MNGIIIRKRVGMIMMLIGWILALLAPNIFGNYEDMIGIEIIVAAVCIVLVQPIGLLIMGKGVDGSPSMMANLINFVMRVAGIFSFIAVCIPIFPINLLFAFCFGLTGALVCMVIAVFGGTIFAIVLGLFDYIRTFIYLKFH